jgi:hypothetical protein
MWNAGEPILRDDWLGWGADPAWPVPELAESWHVV